MVGGFEKSKLATDTTKDTVCTRSLCIEGYNDNMQNYWKECCYGHFEDSQMYDFETGNRSNYFGPTNGATVNATDPTRSSYSMPYIYDHFTWDHCETELGGDLNGELEALYLQAADS